MKRFALFCMALFAVLAVTAQNSLPVETFRLDNGLKVILCEEHSQPKIYGCVVVHAGSKNENPNATGVAHYFEHIMFKGTDRIGTTNWAKEKPYLDSISQAYDRLQAAENDKERHDIQLEINRLSIAASQYAIPNEVDAILQNMGCTGLNAGTSYDYTVYYNTLPSNQLANWMDVYVERFRNPVFRLFQSELETIYEEKNRGDNKIAQDIFQAVNKMMLEVLAAFAEEERRTIRKRQREGIEAARKNGVHLGRPALKRPATWDEDYEAWKAGKVSAVSLWRDKYKISKSAFYKLAKAQSEQAED